MRGKESKKNNLYKNILYRGIFLLLFSFLLTFWFSSYIKQATGYVSTFEEGLTYTTLSMSVSEVLEDMSPIIKVPLPLMRFNAYAYNDMKVTGSDLATSTNLNIDFLGKYTTIQTGETKPLKKDFNFNPGLTFERSIATLSNGENLSNNLNGKFMVFFKLTFKSFILIWFIFMIPIVYAFIVIFSSTLKFILTGSPFTKVVAEFRDKKNHNSRHKKQ